MQSSGTAAGPGSECRPFVVAVFCGTRLEGAGLMLGPAEAITMFYALAAELCAVPDRCWLRSMPGPPDLVRCQSGLGFGFGEIFAPPLCMIT